MQIKFLKSIVENLTNKQSAEIVDLLANKKDVNEFILAKKLNLTINQTRNILYKLLDFGLVSFIRKKDKRKGWYIYFWTLNIAESLKLLEKKLMEELGQLELQLKSRHEKRYYFCDTCVVEVSEEAALLNDFRCPECEEVYKLSENKEPIEQLEKKVNKVKKELEFVSEEKGKEDEKNTDKKIKKIKRTEANVKSKRKKARVERAILKKKNNPKKISKKTDKAKKTDNAKKSSLRKIKKLFKKKI